MLISHVQKEKKILETKRLDLDAAKAKLRRAKTQPGKDGVSLEQAVNSFNTLSYGAIPGRPSFSSSDPSVTTPCKSNRLPAHARNLLNLMILRMRQHHLFSPEYVLVKGEPQPDWKLTHCLLFESPTLSRRLNDEVLSSLKSKFFVIITFYFISLLI